MTRSAIVCCLMTFVVAANAQETAGKSLSATLEVYAFPKEGQTAEQQSIDEAACYEWAASNTGVDPFSVQKQAEEAGEKTEEAQAAQQSTRGAGVRGAARGAAAGAVIGEIADDDAGEGAAYGAAAGAIASRREARRQGAETQEQAAAQDAAQQQATEEQVGNFRKAFSACLEGKDYLVKY